MRLIDNAKDWWRMASIRIAFLWSVLVSAWPLLPEQQRIDMLSLVGIPQQYLSGVVALLAFASVVLGRVVREDKLHKPPEESSL